MRSMSRWWISGQSRETIRRRNQWFQFGKRGKETSIKDGIQADGDAVQ